MSSVRGANIFAVEGVGLLKIKGAGLVAPPVAGMITGASGAAATEEMFVVSESGSTVFWGVGSSLHIGTDEGTSVEGSCTWLTISEAFSTPLVTK